MLFRSHPIHHLRLRQALMTMRNRTIAVIVGGLSMLTLCACLTLAAVATSGVVSYGVGFYSLTQYTEGNNEWIVYFNETCVKKRPARRGRSHEKPEWTGY